MSLAWLLAVRERLLEFILTKTQFINMLCIGGDIQIICLKG